MLEKRGFVGYRTFLGSLHNRGNVVGKATGSGWKKKSGIIIGLREKRRSFDAVKVVGVVTVLLLSSILLPFTLFSRALVFQTGSQSDFDEGTYNNTHYNSTGGFVQLNATHASGSYTSKVFDAGSNATWNTISWWRGYGFELPNYKTSDDYIVNPANMTGNVLLMHLNEENGTIVDYSGEGNNGINHGATYGVEGKYNTALDFDGANDYVNIKFLGEWRNQDRGYQRGVIKDGRIYTVGGGDSSVPSFPAHVFVFDLKTGEIVNQSPSLGNYTFTASETAPVINGDIVYACPTKANIWAWNMTSNTTIWTTNDLSIWCSKIEFDGSCLYAVTTDYKVKKIDVSNGSVVASFDMDPDSDYENAVSAYLDETKEIVFAIGGKKFYKLWASNLTEIWNKTVSNGGNLDGGAGHSRMSPIVVNDSYTNNEPWVVFGCYGNDKFFAFDYDGNEKWTKSILEGVRAIATYNPNLGYVYIPSMGDRIYVLNITDGVTQFTIDSAPTGSSFTRPCTISNDFLIIKTTGATQCLHIYNATNGQHIKEIIMGTNLHWACFPIGVSEGFLVTGGTLVNCGGSDGGVFVAKAGKGQAVDYYPLYGPYKYGYIENALTELTDDDLNPTDEITLEAWANLDNLVTGSNDHLICRQKTYCLKFAQDNANDAPCFQLYSDLGSWHNLILSSPLNTGEWYHLVGTWDGSTMKFYINGDLKGTLNFEGTMDTNGYATYIGSYDGSSGQTPDGTVDEVSIWNRCLSADEVLNHYKRGVLRLNFSVRSSDDKNCSGANWLDINDTSPHDLSIADNRYFQYRAGFEIDNINYSPELYNVTIDYSVSLPPNKPVIVSGPGAGIKEREYSFTARSIDPKNESVYYKWDWDDGEISGWLGPFDSGDNITASHIWEEEGEYRIKVLAKNINGFISKWSEPSIVHIINESMLKNAFLFGLINGFNEYGDFPCFNATVLLHIRLLDFDIRFYSSDEKLVISKYYLGFLEPHFIIGLFNAVVVSDISTFSIYSMHDHIRRFIA